MINIRILGNGGTGLAQNVEVADNTTVQGAFDKFTGFDRAQDPKSYTILRNGVPCGGGDGLEDGDVVSIIATQVKGG